MACMVCLLPACLQFIDPRHDEATFESPSLFSRRVRVRDRDFQHSFPSPRNSADEGPEKWMNTQHDSARSEGGREFENCIRVSEGLDTCRKKWLKPDTL